METLILIQKYDQRSGSRFKQHKVGDVGFDLEVWEEKEITTIEPYSFCELQTGLYIKVGDNCWGMVRPRSSTVFKKRLFVMEGTIDSGYTGKMFILVYNPNPFPVNIFNGDSLAQIVPVPKFDKVQVKEVISMPKTERGIDGFGSTGGLNV